MDLSTSKQRQRQKERFLYAHQVTEHPHLLKEPCGAIPFGLRPKWARRAQKARHGSEQIILPLSLMP